MMASRAQEGQRHCGPRDGAGRWRRELGDGAYVVYGVTGSGQGRWRRIKGP
jgi:hypothetical protein